MPGKPNSRIDLGLALLSAHAVPGMRYELEEIAAWAGCSFQRIHQIEEQALRKIRARLSPALLQEFRDHLATRK